MRPLVSRYYLQADEEDCNLVIFEFGMVCRYYFIVQDARFERNFSMSFKNLEMLAPTWPHLGKCIVRPLYVS